jgi:hypothetical protein
MCTLWHLDPTDLKVVSPDVHITVLTTGKYRMGLTSSDDSDLRLMIDLRTCHQCHGHGGRGGDEDR